MAILRLRVVEYGESSAKDLLSSALVSVWRPTEDIQQEIRETRSYHLYKVTAGGSRLGELQLNSGKQTAWSAVKNPVRDSRPSFCGFLINRNDKILFRNRSCAVSSGR